MADVNVTLSDNFTLSDQWIANDTFYFGGGGVPVAAQDSIAVTDRSFVNDVLHLVFLENIVVTDGFIANDTLRKLLSDSIAVNDLFTFQISDLLDAGTGTLEATLTDNGRALFTRFVQGEITFAPVEFRVGRGGYDPTNFLQTLAIDTTALDLDDPIITNIVVNGQFTNGLTGWEDISFINGSGGSIAFNADHMDLIAGGGANSAQTEQALITKSGQLYDLEFDIAGGGSNLQVRIGTTSSTEPSGGGQIYTATQATGTHRIGFKATGVQTWLGFVNDDPSTTYELDNVKVFEVFEIQQVETPTSSTLAFLCRLTLLDGNFGLGELGIWSEIKSSTISPNEVGNKSLFAIVHHPVWAKTARNTVVHRVIVQL